jgi:hypothetical protein
MPIGRPRAELVLSAEEQAQLPAVAASRSLPHAMPFVSMKSETAGWG